MNNDKKINQTECIQIGQYTLNAEAEAIQQTAARLGPGFHQAVEILLEHQDGKVIVTGIGKSGHIAEKIATTLCSTGTQAVFLHATEAVHGDLGIYTPGDPTIIISKSGSTAELVRLIPILREFHSPLIGILGNLNSPLARSVDVLIDASVRSEADPLNLAPTSSSVVALAIGDALAAALMKARGFDASDFARFHPSGQLGRNLFMVVADLMHPPEKVAIISRRTPMRQVVIEMTRFPLGAACVVDEQNMLEGLITDGDLRRILSTNEEPMKMEAGELMTKAPVTIYEEASIKMALEMMENRPSQISVLPVTDEQGFFKGLIRIHDIYMSDVRE